MTIEVLHRDDLALGGFAGLKERRLVMAPKLFGSAANSNTWSGLANFVFLSDANFNPKGETTLHSHQEIDVISIMLEGRLNHQGSLENGQGLEVGDVQVQRAGGEGFSHNEINPDNVSNRMLQLWVLPEQAGEPADYKFYKLQNKLTRVYGGKSEQDETFSSHIVIDIALLTASQNFSLEKPFLAYLATGKAKLANLELQEGDLFQGEQLNFTAESDVMLIVIYEI